MKTNTNTQEETPEPNGKNHLMPNPIKWTKELADKLLKDFLSKYLATPITGLLLYNFMTGQKESINLFFNIKLSKMDLVRLGFMMGMSYDMMNVAFAEYRIKYKLNGRLNSTSCPKTREAFMNGGQIVKELQDFLKENDYPFIYSLQPKQDKIRYIRNLIQDREINIQILEEEMRRLQAKIDYETTRRNGLELMIESIEYDA
jgi:hypothetical protein